MKELFHNSLTSINSYIWEHIVNGTVKKNISFNSPALATLGKKYLKVRTMIIRKVDKEKKTLIFYTDKRSQKAIEIKNNSSLTLHFYDFKKKVQFVCYGKGSLENNSIKTKKIWKSMPEYSKINYMYLFKPGTKLKSQEKIPLLDDKKAFLNFSLIHVKVQQIDWLYLSREGNKRAIFNYNKKNLLEAKWVAP